MNNEDPSFRLAEDAANWQRNAHCYFLTDAVVVFKPIGHVMYVVKLTSNLAPISSRPWTCFGLRMSCGLAILCTDLALRTRTSFKL